MLHQSLEEGGFEGLHGRFPPCQDLPWHSCSVTPQLKDIPTCLPSLVPVS